MHFWAYFVSFRGLKNVLPDKVADSSTDGHHGGLQVGHGVAVLALLVENDQLADLLGHRLQDVGDRLGLVERHPDGAERLNIIVS